ncbi:MAG: hypothetical protein K6F00_07575 [Lachnospiraceae bacterium]|nr:hypothetical protein [Lachnospiraceae bacterium]
MVEYINAMNVALTEDARLRHENKKRRSIAKRFVIVEPLCSKDNANNGSPPKTAQQIKFKPAKKAPPPEPELIYKDPDIGSVIDFIA